MDIRTNTKCLNLSHASILHEQNFSAWGLYRDPNTWAFTSTTASSVLHWFNRGYTSHEYHAAFGLLNMNARMYDPATGRVISPDPYVVDPHHTQACNRFSYCLYNPMKYTDPSGEIVVPILIGAAIEAYIGGSVANSNYNPTQWNYSSGKTWAGIGIGAGFGALGGWGFSAGAPALAGTGFFSHFGLYRKVAAYTLAGGVTRAAIGYSSSFAEGMLYSRGNLDYSHQIGIAGLQVGSLIGRFIGGVAGLASGYELPKPNLPEIDYSNLYSPSHFGESTLTGSLDKNSSFGLNAQGVGGTWDLNGDGRLQKNEANNWWLNGGGITINVNNAYIDWTGVKILKGAAKGSIFAINTTDAFLKLPYETAATYGGTSFKVVSNMHVQVLDQLYHYQYRPNNSAENMKRNFMNWYGKPKGQGKDYMIHYYNPIIRIK